MSRIRFLAALAAVVVAAGGLASWAATGVARADNAVTVQRIVPAQPTGAPPDRVGVLVFFDFTPASERLLREVRQWAAGAGDGIVLDMEPVDSGKHPELARGFVVARTLGVTATVLPGLFQLGDSPLKDKQLHQALASLFQDAGINGLEFNAAWKSNATRSGVMHAQSLAERFDIAAAPAVVVNGVWRLTAAGPAGLMGALQNKVAQVAASETENQ